MTRVLVIDDDASIRRVIAYALSDEGYHVDQASDGQEALDLIARRHPNVILLDMKMPGLDGWAFVQLYRQRYERRAPIIVLTAAQDAAKRSAEVKADGYVPKPFDLDLLIERVTASARAQEPPV